MQRNGMRLTVFAATGGVGRQILEQAVTAGHDVTAVVRSPQKLSEYAETVRVVTADLANPDPTALKAAVNGADAVLSGLGPRSQAEAGVATEGTRAMVAAMMAAGVRRLAVVSAAPVGTVPSPDRPSPPKHDPGDNLIMRHLLGPLLKRVLRRHHADLATMEYLVRTSNLDWTIVRPPRLTNDPLTGRYRTAHGQNVRGGWSISRADVAHLMLGVLEQPATFREVVAIAN